MFLGVVDRTDPPFREGLAWIPAQTVWVTVVEPFKGAAQGRQFVLKQPGHGCAPKFRAGERVVFYIEPSGGDAWEAHGCHRTRVLADAADDLLFLRNLPRSAASNRLSGVVSHFEDSHAGDFRKVAAIAGLTVKISGKDGPREAVTDADGVYEVYGLPPGDYTVGINPPPGLKIKFPMFAGAAIKGFARTRLDSASVTLNERSAASVDFVLVEDTSISGKVLDPDGRPMKDVCLDMEPSTGGAKNFRVFDCTKEDGSYLLKDMPSGSYLIVANRTSSITAKSPFRATYYPGVNDKSAATVVAVARGEARTGIDIRIPKVEPRIALSGKVQFSDGVPVPNASLVLMVAGRRADGSRTGLDGKFQFAALQGGSGKLRAEILTFMQVADQCPEWRPKSPTLLFTIASVPVSISTDRDRQSILLTLPVPSCKAWPERL